MYGTIARLRVAPGLKGTFLNWVKYSSWTLRTVPGLVESRVYEMDASRDMFIMAVVFESREAYLANANSPEQHQEYLQMMEFLTSAPEWNDGEIVWRG